MTQPIVPKELLTATPGGLSLLVISGGSDGHVLTQQADGTYAPEAASGGGSYLPLTGGTLTGDLKFTDATYDIGKSGATRPRDGFFSRNITAGNTGTFANLVVSNGVSLVQCNVGSTGYFQFGSRSIIYSAALGTFKFMDINETSGVTLDVATDAICKVRTRAGSADASLTALNLTASALICAGTYTVGTLPSAAANAYKFATVSDSSVITFGSTVAAGGSSKVMVFSNGTNWTVFAI